MKVLAINSSPRMDRGNTALILNPFLEGMKEAGEFLVSLDYFLYLQFLSFYFQPKFELSSK